MVPPFDTFADNAQHVLALLTLHEEKNADEKTQNTHEILTKSCVVLLVACWEAFVEDCAERAVDFLVANAESPEKLPKELLKCISSELKSDKNDLKIWELAGDGWKITAKEHYKKMLNKHLSPFNTPRAGNIDALYKSVLGLDDLSSCWHWEEMSNKNAKDKLSDAITLRGAIAHRVQTSEKVTHELADGYAIHLIYLSVKTSNAVRNHIHHITGQYPWMVESIEGVS